MTTSQGGHYSRDDAVRYRLGHSVTRSLRGKSRRPIEGFAGGDALTRAEAFHWVRQIKLSGMLSLKIKPEEPTSPSLLPPPLSVGDAQDRLPDFSTVTLTPEDLVLKDTDKEITIKLGDTREIVESHYGESRGKIFGKFDSYYDAEGRVDGG
ncbi:hypothetical protein WMW72_16675 [Paenibacillus filicis]|uniref:Uncharacterized protein n=1 Tax=Paenibacillus filicis TaxID=669464 RepID=A0ABU9DL23_9BACL